MKSLVEGLIMLSLVEATTNMNVFPLCLSVLTGFIYATQTA